MYLVNGLRPLHKFTLKGRPDVELAVVAVNTLFLVIDIAFNQLGHLDAMQFDLHDSRLSLDENSFESLFPVKVAPSSIHPIGILIYTTIAAQDLELLRVVLVCLVSFALFSDWLDPLFITFMRFPYFE